MDQYHRNVTYICKEAKDIWSEQNLEGLDVKGPSLRKL